MLTFLIGGCNLSSVGKQFGETKNRKDSVISLSKIEHHKDDSNFYFIKGKRDSIYIISGYLLRQIYKCHYSHLNNYDSFKTEVLSGRIIISNDNLNLDGFTIDADISNLYYKYGIKEVKKRFLIGSHEMEFISGLSYNKKMTIAYFMEKEGFFYSENSFSGKESMFSNYKKNTK